MMIFILIIIIASICLGKYYFSLFLQENKTKVLQDDFVTQEKTSDDPMDQWMDFDKIKQTNQDIYAWIYIPNTLVNYPILQSKDNMDEDYYLTHNLDLSSGYPGCIYTQKRNSKDFTDRDTVIYGHNMRDNSMFGSLHQYEDAEFFKNNPDIYIYTPQKTLHYRIFTTFESDDKLILNYYHDFKEDSVYQDYLSGLIANTNEKANIDSSVSLGKDDKMITLSTCMGNDSYRYLVCAYLKDEKVLN